MSGISKARPTKWWATSMTLWGTAVTAATTVLPVVAPLLGLSIDTGLVGQIGQQGTQLLQALGGVLGTGLSIYGRVRSTHDLVTMP